jgi:hypothetical protein
MTINLASTRLAFFLIAVLVALIIVSAIIPQQDFADAQILDWRDKLGSAYAIVDWLGLDRIYYNPTLFVVVGLLALNLSVANVRRFRTVYRVERTFLKLRHIGSILFHLSLLIVMIGTVLHFLFKYEGVFSITEGQRVFDRPESYFREFRGPLSSDDYNNFTLSLEAIGHLEREVEPLGSTAAVVLEPTSGEAFKAVISRYEPVAWRDYKFHYGSKTGYAPELLLLDSVNHTLFRSFMRVARQKHEGRDVHYDFVELNEPAFKIELEVLPSGISVDSVQYKLDISSADSTLFSGVLASQDTARFAGYQFTVPRLRRWCYIGAIKNPFLNVIFTGFWLSLTGLCLSLLGRIVPARS